MSLKGFRFPTEVQEILHKNFSMFCLDGDIDSVRSYLHNYYLDLTHESGLCAIYAAMNGHIDILEILFFECSEIKEFLHDILSAAANYGRSDCVKFLINAGANPRELKGTTAYSNDRIRLIFEEWEAENPLPNDDGEYIKDIVDYYAHLSRRKG